MFISKITWHVFVKGLDSPIEVGGFGSGKKQRSLLNRFKPAGVLFFGNFRWDCDYLIILRFAWDTKKRMSICCQEVSF